MKTQIIQFDRNIISRLGKLLVPTAALFALSACAPFDNVLERNDSPLPVETVHASSGRIDSVYAHESGDRLFVAGFMRRTTSTDRKTKLTLPEAIAEVAGELSRNARYGSGGCFAKGSVVTSKPSQTGINHRAASGAHGKTRRLLRA